MTDSDLVLYCAQNGIPSYEHSLYCYFIIYLYIEVPYDLDLCCTSQHVKQKSLDVPARGWQPQVVSNHLLETFSFFSKGWNSVIVSILPCAKDVSFATFFVPDLELKKKKTIILLQMQKVGRINSFFLQRI
jgi:hypothetical protein